MTVSRGDIETAAVRIAGRVRRTPVIELAAGDIIDGVPVCLKLELLQHAGSFKPRGAFNAMLSRDVPDTGVVAASGGNHGAAVAFAARELGHRAEIFVPTIASPAKLQMLKDYGAILNVVGKDFAEALSACESRRAETGAILLHAYDQPEILAGQGTVGLEFQNQAPSLDTLLVSVGGGGLIGGVASWYRGEARLIAVESEGTPTLHSARSAGKAVEIAVGGLAADSLGARLIGSLCFHDANPFIADSVLVSDDAIARTQRLLWDRFRLISEPGGATALAALLDGKYRPASGERVGVLLCGGNTSPANAVFTV